MVGAGNFKEGDAAGRTEMYRELGLTVTHHPQERRAVAEARPVPPAYTPASPAGTAPGSPWVLAAEFALERRAGGTGPR